MKKKLVFEQAKNFSSCVLWGNLETVLLRPLQPLLVLSTCLDAPRELREAASTGQLYLWLVQDAYYIFLFFFFLFFNLFWHFCDKSPESVGNLPSNSSTTLLCPARKVVLGLGSGNQDWWAIKKTYKEQMWQVITGDVIGDLAAVTRQEQCKGRFFGGMLSTLFFWDSSNLKTQDNG